MARFSRVNHANTAPADNAGIKALRLTDEQVSAAEIFHKGYNLKVNAFAGTGKTSTLLAMADQDRRKGLYLAFNRSIADYARSRFPARVECRTINSLAFNAVKNRYNNGSGKLTDKLNAYTVAKTLRIEPLTIEGVLLPARTLGYLVIECCRNFLYSDCDQLTEDFVSFNGKTRYFAAKHQLALANYISKKAQALWLQMRDPKSPVALGHDGYIKVWALTRPVLEYDYLMLDEAQDSSPVMLDVLSQQTTQIVYVGDRHQQIYQWRGAVNAMERTLRQKV